MEKNRSKFSAQSTSEQGFALVFLLTILPLLLAGLTFLFIGTTQIELRSSLNQICRSQLLETQDTASSHIQTLMALNPLVDVAKFAKFIVILSSILGTVNPILGAVLRGISTASKSISAVLPKIQKAILLSLRATLNTGLFNGKKRIDSTLNDFFNKAKNLIEAKKLWTPNPFVLSLSVEPVNPNAKLTKYRLKKDFISIQSIEMNWQYQLKTASPLMQWATWKQTFSGSCSATLKKEEPWRPTLVAAKFSWKPY